MPAKNSQVQHKSAVVRTTKKPKTQAKRKSVSEKAPSRRDITLKALRAQDVKRSASILRLVPNFIKFYKKMSPAQITALKFYKGFGSYFQSSLLANYNNEKGKLREFTVPFSKYEDMDFYRDILGTEKKNAIYSLYLPNTTNLDTYIDESYGKRVKILNDFDTVYDHPDCPKLTGEEILFRGMHEITDAIKKLKPGDTYLFKNFISTTFDRKVAERFSGGECVFVLSGLKDIPCIYTPHPKASDDIIKFINNVKIKMDISELTLPRNLEFEITNIERRNINAWNFNSTNDKIGELLKALQKRGVTSEEDVIENAMFPKGTFIFARFKSWLPREPIDFVKIKKDSKFVLDTWALKTWTAKEEDDN